MSFTPLKVLFVTNMYPDRNDPGAGTFVHQQAEHLRRIGHQIDILHIQSKKSRANYLASALHVFTKTCSTRYHVVHAHYGLSGLPALFRYKTPLVVTLHGSDALVGRIQPFISKSVCALADAVIVVSNNISSRIAGEVIPCGIDLNLFKPIQREKARARLGLPLDGKLVLFPFDPSRKIKRYELAKAAVDVIGSLDVRILAVFGKRIEDMPWYYSAADAMILCSYSEGSPTSVKEALACNLPVISTDIGDVREIMAGTEGSEICDSTPPSLAQGLRRALSRPGVNLRESRSCMLRYDQARIAAQIEKVYRRVITKGGGDEFAEAKPYFEKAATLSDRVIGLADGRTASLVKEKSR